MSPGWHARLSDSPLVSAMISGDSPGRTLVPNITTPQVCGMILEPWVCLKMRYKPFNFKWDLMINQPILGGFLFQTDRERWFPKHLVAACNGRRLRQLQDMWRHELQLQAVELPWNPQRRQVQETGFFQTLWQGAAAAIGVVRLGFADDFANLKGRNRHLCTAKMCPSLAGLIPR